MASGSEDDVPNGGGGECDDDVKVPVPFRWTEGGSEVLLAGSFDHWVERYPMNPLAGSAGIFTIILQLKPGIYTYKFIVDGQWRCAAAQQSVTDEAGNMNNCRSVTLPSALRKHPAPRGLPSSTTGLALVAAAPSEAAETRLLQNQYLLSGVHSKPRPASDNSRMTLGGRKLVLVMVGLPARGKSFVAGKISRYLRWLGYSSRQFNIGSYRRAKLGDYLSHDFYRPDNPEGVAARLQLAMLAVDDMLSWLYEGGHVAVLDGANSTRARRQAIVSRIKNSAAEHECSLKVIFIEILCNRPDVIAANVLKKFQFSPDYVGFEEQSAIADFTERIRHYESSYETLDVAEEYSFMKIFDVGAQTMTHRIYGFLPTKIIFFLMNLHLSPRPIYISRHGESVYNSQDRIGGDSPLTDKGFAYAAKLREFMEKEHESGSIPGSLDTSLVVWCSTMLRTQQTAESVPCAQLVCWKALEEIDVGICDGMTPAEFEANFPSEFKARLTDKLNYRYPRGEGYADLIKRIEPVIIELERATMPVLVIAHQAVGRCLYAYFQDLPFEDVPFAPMPLHTVIKLEQKAYVTSEHRFKLLADDGSETAGSVGSVKAHGEAATVVKGISGETH